jgi:hypothetical protein
MSIRQFIRISSIIAGIGFRFHFKRKSGVKFALNYLRQLEMEFGEKFEKNNLRKIVRYYSLHQLLSIDIFTKLHGRMSNSSEREKVINYSILHVLFDDFFDEKTHSFEQIYEMTFEPEKYKAEKVLEKVFLKSHLFLLNGVKDRDHYLKICRNLYDMQIASMEQFDPEITYRRLEQITFEKGGNAIYMCHFYVEFEVGEEERKAWYLLGEILQLEGDIFDLHDDVRDGIQTLPRKINNAYLIEEFYLKKLKQLEEQIYLLPFSSERKDVFLIEIMSINSLGLVATDQLKRIQGNEKSFPDLKSFSRKDLNVDLEKLHNIWKWICIAYRTSIKLTN